MTRLSKNSKIFFFKFCHPLGWIFLSYYLTQLQNTHYIRDVRCMFLHRPASRSRGGQNFQFVNTWEGRVCLSRFLSRFVFTLQNWPVIFVGKNPSFCWTLNSTCVKGVNNQVWGNFTVKIKCAAKLHILILPNSVDI